MHCGGAYTVGGIPSMDGGWRQRDVEAGMTELEGGVKRSQCRAAGQVTRRAIVLSGTGPGGVAMDRARGGTHKVTLPRCALRPGRGGGPETRSRAGRGSSMSGARAGTGPLIGEEGSEGGRRRARRMRLR